MHGSEQGSNLTQCKQRLSNQDNKWPCKASIITSHDFMLECGNPLNSVFVPIGPIILVARKSKIDFHYHLEAVCESLMFKTIFEAACSVASDSPTGALTSYCVPWISPIQKKSFRRFGNIRAKNPLWVDELLYVPQHGFSKRNESPQGWILEEEWFKGL